jgi:hypothetical protein
MKGVEPQNNVRWGAVAIVWFFGWMGLVGALRPEYGHATKAVSELGALGAPYMVVWNAAGFVGTGVMMVLFALGYRGVLGEAAHGWRALVACGALFAATAIPIRIGADGDPAMGSGWTQAHLVMVVAVPLPWLFALAVMVARHRRTEWRGLAVASGVALVLFVAQVGATVGGLGAGAPGLLQRAGFVVLLGWYFAAALLLRGEGVARAGGVAGTGGGVEGDPFELEANGDRRDHVVRG